MSTSLRIASVTYVLKDLLNNGLIDHDVTGAVGETVTVTALPPDRVIPSNGNEQSQLNLFMYQATPNQGWRNVDQPAFSSRGERIASPPLAIDLHYLLTAYGSAELHTDILLGYGMQLLHETPVLDRESIARSLAPPSDAGDGLISSLRLLSTSRLAEQAEMITITPESLSAEDISKLWAAFGTKYRPTAAYKITVVLIESGKLSKPALPVRGRKIYVAPFRAPQIETIASQSAAGQPIVVNQKIFNGYRLILQGKYFTNQLVQVMVNGEEITGSASELTIDETQIGFKLANLKAGRQEVQIIHLSLMGSPPAPHKGVASRSETFTISPLIIGHPSIEDVEVSGSGLISGTVKLKADPKVEPGQKVILLLNEIVTSGTSKSYSFQMSAAIFGSPPTSTDDIRIEITSVKGGRYLVRIQVDGADSPLLSDASGVFVSPALDIP